jgi:predicted nucleic acid-binding protein
MTTLVLDASVAAKWFLPSAGESLTDEASALLKSYARGRLRLLVPDLFWIEFANILWKSVRQGRWPQASAELALRAMRQRQFPTVPSLTILEEAFAIASVFDRTLYDSIYVALAVMSKTQLVTGDERLAKALATHLPVKWLGAL